MESVIGLRFSALPSPSVRIMPSGYHAARAAKSHLRLSCSFPKLESTSLSLGYNSSFSLSRSSGGRRRPLDGIIGPVCCKAEPSPPSQSSSDEKSQQEQQLRNMVQRLLQSRLRDLSDRLKSLEPIIKENVTLSDQIIGIVNVLKESENYVLALKQLKSSEQFIEEEDSLATTRSKIMAILYNQIIDIVDALKKSENYNLALTLLKASEQFFKEEDPLATIRFQIMEILYSQGQYQQAFDYWIRLCEMESLQMRKELFKNMQRDLFSTMTKVVECLKEKIPSNEVTSPDFLRSMNELKIMEIPRLMNIPGEDFLSIDRGEG